MGKTKKNNRIRTQFGAKQSLEEQIEDGRVSKPKTRQKLRLRAEEEEVKEN